MSQKATRPQRPTRAELLEATRLTIDDVIAPDLDVLFVGINPGLYSAAIGHHFGRPGNRFWPTLFVSGFTLRRYTPAEELLLLTHGLGITNIAPRPSARADELSREELVAGAEMLACKVAEYRPKVVAPLGVTAYRTAFGRPGAQVGLQTDRIAGSPLWVLPNPSGLNAHYQLADLARLFGELREWVTKLPSAV